MYKYIYWYKELINLQLKDVSALRNHTFFVSFCLVSDSY